MRKEMLLPAALLTLAAQAQERPNIIYIMCDDMGYGDLGCYGQKLIATPHLDRMAQEGMRFTQAYAGSPVSAPSRATVMTGQHTGHTHVRGNKEYWPGHDVRNLYGSHTEPAEGWAGQEPYAPNHKLLTEIFQENGYRTGMFGKWAGGYESSHSTPDKRGVDEFYGYVCQYQAHSYYPNFLNAYSKEAGDEGVHRVVMEQNIQHGMPGSSDYLQRAQYSADLIHQKALAWIDKQTKDQPFIGIFTYTLPHAELAQPDDSLVQAYRGMFCTEKAYTRSASRYHTTEEGHTQFAAMVTRLDVMVGEVLARLKARGLDENTMVIFTSDNGPHEEGGADPAFFNRDGLLRGIKRSTYEGGIRIPFIVRWPGKVKAGAVSDHQLAFYDLLSTFCDVAHINDFPQRYQTNEAAYADGISFYPTLVGRAAEQRQHEALYWEFHETNMLAVRKGDWKLVVERGTPRLYNLATDIHEDKDVAGLHPEILKELIDIVHREHTHSSLFPVTLPQRR